MAALDDDRLRARALTYFRRERESTLVEVRHFERQLKDCLWFRLLCRKHLVAAIARGKHRLDDYRQAEQELMAGVTDKAICLLNEVAEEHRAKLLRIRDACPARLLKNFISSTQLTSATNLRAELEEACQRTQGVA